MINVWDYKDVIGKIKVTCTDGQILIGNMGDITDVGEEVEGEEFGEDSITVYVDHIPVGIPQSEIHSIEIMK